MHLAQLGADVIRFDQIGGGIDHERWPVTADGASIYWASLNKGKRSIAIDLRSDQGQALVADLIAAPGEGAGIFLSNFPPRGWMAYDQLRKHRADLIMVSIVGNSDGSTAVDYTVNAAVGYPAVTGPAGDGTSSRSRAVTNHVLPAWDVVCGQQAVIGLLAAERHRARTGEGQLVSIALSDVAMTTVANLGHVAEAQLLGAQRPSLGNDLYGAFGRDFATSDDRRFIAIAISRRQWRNLIQAVDMGAAIEQLEDETGADLNREGDRFEHREAVAALIADWGATRTLAEVGIVLDEHGVCWGPYQDFLQLVAEDARCSADNPVFAELDQPGIGRVLAPGTPLTFGAHPRTPPAPAPSLGQHTEEILAADLGLAAAEIGRLFDDGVVA